MSALFYFIVATENVGPKPNQALMMAVDKADMPKLQQVDLSHIPEPGRVEMASALLVQATLVLQTDVTPDNCSDVISAFIVMLAAGHHLPIDMRRYGGVSAKWDGIGLELRLYTDTAIARMVAAAPVNGTVDVFNLAATVH